MGNKFSCCAYKTSKSKNKEEVYQPSNQTTQGDDMVQLHQHQSLSSLPGSGSVPHISDRENLPEGY